MSPRTRKPRTRKSAARRRRPLPRGSAGTPRVVILGGAGAMGVITARDLAETSRGAVQVVIADRDLRGARGLGLETIEVDVTNPASLRFALEDAAVTIASLPYRFNLEAMHGALEAGCHYVDLGGLFHMTRRQMKLKREFQRRGLMALLGMGSAPGILNVMAVAGALGMESVDEVHCLVGSVDRTRFRNPPPLGFGYSVDTLLDEFELPSAVYRRGKFKMVPPLDPGERSEVRFPNPVGKLFVDTTLHSEVATLPHHFADRGVHEVTFRQGFEHEFMEKLAFLVRLGMAGTKGLPVTRRGSHVSGRSRESDVTPMTPRQMLLQLLERFPKAEPIGKPNCYEVLRTVVSGKRGGRHVTVTYDCHAGPDAGGGVGPDIDTGAPPSIAVQLMLSGEMEVKPGVWAPEDVVPVKPFLRDVERRGMKVHRRSQAAKRARHAA